MKKLIKGSFILLVLIFSYFTLMFCLSELGGEVVTLIKSEEDNSSKKIRIWIVDSKNVSWIEHGDKDAYWMKKIADNNKIYIIRDNEKKSYKATVDSESHELYHKLRRTKYSWADRMLDILAFGAISEDKCSGIPVRLELL